MTESVFTLAPRGDSRWSYRFTEAVCSGSVPVIIGTDGWMMPLDHLAPFDPYGIFIPAKDGNKTIQVLRTVSK